jgi:uncharacterized membrane protein YbhN (UPF0104 family)
MIELMLLFYKGPDIIGGLSSGVVRGYSLIMITISVPVIVLSLLSLLSFKSDKSPKFYLRIFVFNIVVLLVASVWLPLVYNGLN